MSLLETENNEQNNEQDNETPENDASNNEVKSSNTSNGTGGFMVSLLVPLVGFYFVCYKLYSGSFDNPDDRLGVPSKVAILKILLLVVIFSSMYASNTAQMKKMCPNGTKNMVRKVFFSTFIPFLFMFGTIVVALTMMPGWKAPFSNTLGS